MSEKETDKPVESPEETLEPIRIKEKNPALRLLKRLFIGLVCVVVILFGSGLIIGLLGYRAPVIEFGVFTDKANEVLNPEEPSNPRPTTSPTVSVSPSAAPTVSATPLPEPTVTEPTSPTTATDEQRQDAVNAGFEVGQIFKQYKGLEREFWFGFNAASE